MMRKTMDVVKEKYGKHVIVGAEVGVSGGIHALNILQNMPNIKLLYLVDPYLEGSIWAVHKKAAKQKISEATKKATKQKMSPFNNRTRWIYKQFEECTVKDIPDPLDFIYIDGNHAYEHIKKDITLATQLVKKGGVIGGHDIGSLGIDRAVKEFCDVKKIEFNVENNGQYMVHGVLKCQGWDWWFINV